jgi:hypothetical protein
MKRLYDVAGTGTQRIKLFQNPIEASNIPHINTAAKYNLKNTAFAAGTDISGVLNYCLTER